MQPITDILNEIKKRNLNISEIARNMDIPVQRFHKWIRGENLPKTEDAEKLRLWAAENLEKSINETQGIKMEDTGEEYQTLGKPAAYQAKILFNLTESNRVLSESNKTIAEANKKLADNTVQLTKSYTDLVVNASPKNDISVYATVQALQESLIEIFAKVNKTTVEKAASLLGIKMVQKMTVLQKTGSAAGAGK